MSSLYEIRLKLLKNKKENKLILGPSDKINYEIKITCKCGNPNHILITEENGQIVVEGD